MEKIESEEIEFPRVGPFYIGNMASSLTRIPDYEASILRELQELQAESYLDSSQLCGDELLDDELKVYAEEELIDMAMKEAFKL